MYNIYLYIKFKSNLFFFIIIIINIFFYFIILMNIYNKHNYNLDGRYIVSSSYDRTFKLWASEDLEY